jgi:Fe-S oxidoreductase
MTREINTTAAVNKFLAHISGDLGAYLEGCLHCGLCADACHFYAVTKDPRYTPAYKLFPMARTYKRSKPPLSWFGGAPKITEKDLQEWEELLFDSCTMCGRCTMVCPMGIDIASIVSVSRQAFVAAGLGPPDLLQAAENSRDKGSPLGVTKEVLADRVEWMEDEHEVDIPLDKESADILLTVSSIELMKYPESLVAMTKLLNHAGVNWTLSSKGYEATNFGFLSGKADVAKVMIERITTAAESIGAKTVIVPECGHAFGALRWSGANILGRPLPYEVMHITEYLADLKHHGKLKLLPFDDSITYHDPCQISRRGGATQAARDLLDGVATDFREMSPTGNYNWCCGGGGGVQAMSSATDLRHKVFKLKMEQVEATGADTMISSCSNCRLTMDESKEHWHWDKGLDSLVEILAEHIDLPASRDQTQ